MGEGRKKMGLAKGIPEAENMYIVINVTRWDILERIVQTRRSRLMRGTVIHHSLLMLLKTVIKIATTGICSQFHHAKHQIY